MNLEFVEAFSIRDSLRKKFEAFKDKANQTIEENDTLRELKEKAKTKAGELRAQAEEQIQKHLKDEKFVKEMGEKAEDFAGKRFGEAGREKVRLVTQGIKSKQNSDMPSPKKVAPAAKKTVKAKVVTIKYSNIIIGAILGAMLPDIKGATEQDREKLNTLLLDKKNDANVEKALLDISDDFNKFVSTYSRTTKQDIDFDLIDQDMFHSYVEKIKTILETDVEEREELINKLFEENPDIAAEDQEGISDVDESDEVSEEALADDEDLTEEDNDESGEDLIASNDEADE